MVRAAAKNFRHVAVVVDPADYPLLLEQLDREGGIDAATRLYFAQKAFRHTGALRGRDRRLLLAGRGARGGLRAGRGRRVFPYRLSLTFEKVQDLRYGENPHQRAAFYSDLGSTLYSVAAARKLQGKELSFNNILDLDAAWRLVTELDDPACVIVKHTNPCGTGARARARSRPTSAPGRATRPRPSAASWPSTAKRRRRHRARRSRRVFVEAVIAPGFEAEAHEGPRARRRTCA